MQQFKHTCWLILAALATSGALAAEPLMRTDLAPPNELVDRNLPRYLESRAARFVGWLEDGSLLVATRFGETEQVHRVRMALGAREQQSFEAEGVLAAAVQPRHDAAFVYLSPRSNGGTALLLQTGTGQPPVALTDGHFRDGSPLFAHDGQRLAFASNRGSGIAGATGREREIDVLDTAAAVAEMVAPSGAAATGAAAPPPPPPTPALRVIAGGNGYRWRVLDWSPDDQHLLLGREPLATESADMELFTADVASGTLSPLELPHKPEGKAAAMAPTPLHARLARFTADGRGLLLLRAGEAAGVDFLQLQRLDTGSAEPQALSIQSTRDVELFDESPDGHFLAYTSNEGGSSRLTLVDQQHKLDLNPASVPPGVISSLKFDPTGKRLALTLETATSPRDVYVLEPETQQVTRWTQSELGLLAPAKLVTPALVRFPTWDRIDNQPRMLSAYTYRPAAQAAAGTSAGPRPVLILLRSGGGTQYRPVFEPLAQFLVDELGFVVLAPNVRGAAGFGQAFGELARGELRDDAVRDVGSLLVWIGQQHELDFNHIFVLGEGYGAYLALASLAQYGDRLQAGIAAFPPHVANMASLASIRRPLLLVHGRSDPDVPAYEVEQLAARLRTGGAIVQYLAAPDEGARFMRKSNRDAYYAAAANFLAQLTR
ncbi:MAG TPA: prolyl oligopeptidase family serine peptidase [Steroidobacteraceae bacterium]